MVGQKRLDGSESFAKFVGKYLLRILPHHSPFAAPPLPKSLLSLEKEILSFSFFPCCGVVVPLPTLFSLVLKWTPKCSGFLPTDHVALTLDWRWNGAIGNPFSSCSSSSPSSSLSLSTSGVWLDLFKVTAKGENRLSNNSVLRTFSGHEPGVWPRKSFQLFLLMINFIPFLSLNVARKGLATTSGDDGCTLYSKWSTFIDSLVVARSRMSCW